MAIDFRSDAYVERLRSYGASYRDFSQMMEKSEGYYDIPVLPRWVGVRVIWPFGGAKARVLFYDRATPTISVSTYLDVNDELGCMSCKPYFEIYPDLSGDVARFLLDEQAEMYPLILKVLSKRRADARREAKGAA